MRVIQDPNNNNLTYLFAVGSRRRSHAELRVTELCAQSVELRREVSALRLVAAQLGVQLLALADQLGVVLQPPQQHRSVTERFKVS